MADISVKIPRAIEEAYKNGYIYGVMLFGSTIESNQKSNDIDLAVVTKVGKSEEFFRNTLKEDDAQFDLYDISVIKIEDIDTTKLFYFGPHGHYLVESLRNSICLLGANPFEDFPATPPMVLKKSIVERLKDYIYVLRKSYFNYKAHMIFLNTRYVKFLKLAVFLLIEGHMFPQVMRLSSDQASLILREHSYLEINMSKEQTVEHLWEHIAKKYL